MAKISTWVGIPTEVSGHVLGKGFGKQFEFTHDRIFSCRTSGSSL